MQKYIMEIKRDKSVIRTALNGLNNNVIFDMFFLIKFKLINRRHVLYDALSVLLCKVFGAGHYNDDDCADL